MTGGVSYALTCIAEEFFLDNDDVNGALAEKLAEQCDTEVYMEWKEHHHENRPAPTEWEEAWRVFRRAQA